MDPTDELQSQIDEYREATISRRARAFIDCPDTVAGMTVRPITPRTWTMMHATGNRLICGGQPMEGDIRNYLWFHSPLFTQSRFLARPMKWLALLGFSAVLHRRRGYDWYAATLALVGAQLAGIVQEAVADAPKGGGEGSPGPCLEAQITHVLSSAYHWPVEQIRALPLRHAFQLIRCINPDDDDEAERSIRFAHLRKRNAEMTPATQS